MASVAQQESRWFMKRFKGRGGGGRTHWDAFRGFLPGLGQRQEGKKPTVVNNSTKLRRGKAPVGVFTLNECLFQGKSVSEGK